MMNLNGRTRDQCDQCDQCSQIMMARNQTSRESGGKSFNRGRR